MKTTIETIEVFEINSLQEIYDLVGDHQITAQELLNGRAYLEGKGWSTIRLTYEFKSWLCDTLAGKIGGRGNTMQNTRAKLMRQTVPQHWALGIRAFCCG